MKWSHLYSPCSFTVGPNCIEQVGKHIIFDSFIIVTMCQILDYNQVGSRKSMKKNVIYIRHGQTFRNSYSQSNK